MGHPRGDVEDDPDVGGLLREADGVVEVNTQAFVADSEHAAAAFAGSYLELMNRIGRERGWSPSGRVEYEALKSPRGPLALGSPDQVVEKIVSVHDLFQPERYLAHMSIGAVPHREVMRAIELFGTEVAERVTAELRGRPTPGVAVQGGDPARRLA